MDRCLTSSAAIATPARQFAAALPPASGTADPAAGATASQCRPRRRSFAACGRLAARVACIAAPLVFAATQAHAQPPAFAPNQPLQVGVQVKLGEFSPTDATRIRAVGFDFVRLGIWIDRLSDVAYQSRVKAAFANARAAGLPVLMTVRAVDSVSPAAAPTPAALEQAGAKFGAAAAALARSYASQLLAVELWNEPDLGKYWPTGNVEQNFVPYMRAACQQLGPRGQRPAPVIGFGFAHAPSPGSLADALLGQLATAAPDCLDAISYHAYGMTEQAIRATSKDAHARYRLPAVITEWGTPSLIVNGGDDAQADRLKAFLAELPSVGTPVVSIYEWKNTANGGNSRERNFGLVTSSGTDKPALNAARGELRMLLHNAGAAAAANGNGNR